ncbi:alpha-ketoglutarate-dependent dioxygenase AlkB family protein [Streptomyces sp. MCA2]|uniref:alpha-ketoglutarate-dependent dioxygenase AlkB family protein n=1 Tax=Streptomyces sp. MCA2 TaxID=2944805 RepID=UPI0020216AA9|nr:alpha-ketoglutarate-dependent dioxygenase AlkB [Streptomyces sp. MCA2]MCL7490290.1 alpha-ketoglutarate-dependent dioxygenase AlkB [Streptomyces sp. MCA2]
MSTPLPGFEDLGEPAGGPRGSEGSDGPHGADGPHTAGRFHPTASDQGHARAGRREIAPGAVHLPGWLTVAQQRELVTACRGWARGPAPIRHTKLPRGGVMSVQTVCIGWHWQPYAYTRTADDVNGARVAEFPRWMVELGRRALVEAYQDAAAGDDYTPDTALINFYDGQAKLGMHQDKEERSDAPVVSLSIGDTCVFRFGNTETRTKPYTDIELASGDLFVFGGPSRFAYHGVPKVRPGTGDPATGLTSGRLNLTMRVTGLEG